MSASASAAALLIAFCLMAHCDGAYALDNGLALKPP